MKFYFSVLIIMLASCNGVSQSTADKSQREIVMQAIESIIKRDSTTFYSIVDTNDITRHRIVYDFELLGELFQNLKSPLRLDSIKQYDEPNSIWKWNYKTRVYILKSRWNYIDLRFMFSSENSTRVFYFDKEVEFRNDQLIAPSSANK